jgi:hypothetical protein
VDAQPSAGPASSSPLDLAVEFPRTSIVAHAPGWTRTFLSCLQSPVPTML